VLPLENLSDDPNEQFFSDGLTEEIITQLSRLQPTQLGVIARTSSMHYKGTRKRVDEIGRELQVDYILEGSVRRDEQRVRISVQLIRVSDQTHLWATNYERDLRDILALQSSVADSVAREIRVKLTENQRFELASALPVNPKAHELYLRGRYLWNQRTVEALQKSIEYFQQAIAEDPTYAASYAALADAYNISGNWGILPPNEAYPRAKAAASQALEINGRLAEARVALAYAIYLHDWNAAAAEKEFKNALELNPNYAPGHQWYAVYLASAGRFEEAITHVTRARELDPLSLIIGDVVGWIYSLARQHDRAIEEFHKTIELDPKFYPTHYDLGMTYADKGMHREAIAALETARTLSGDSVRTLSGLAYTYAMAGQREKANRLLGDLRVLGKKRYVPPFDIAVVYAALGEKDLAFHYLEKAFEERHPWLVMIRVTPKLDRLRSDPRFEDLTKRVGM
jgi:TolB-like protein/Tfp pilus assembly protein PilF